MISTDVWVRDSREYRVVTPHLVEDSEIFARGVIRPTCFRKKRRGVQSEVRTNRNQSPWRDVISASGKGFQPRQTKDTAPCSKEIPSKCPRVKLVPVYLLRSRVASVGAELMGAWYVGCRVRAVDIRPSDRGSSPDLGYPSPEVRRKVATWGVFS